MGDVFETSRDRSLLVVAGPGRSGTSLVTGLIARLGFHVPQPELRPARANPKGFGEPKWTIAFHKGLMAAAGINLGDTRPEAIELATRAGARDAVRRELVEWLAGQFEIAERLIVKDPRLLWFWGVYRRAAQELDVDFVVLTMLRQPAETIRSANMAYGGLPVSTRAAGWINATLAVQRTSRTAPRASVSYDELMTDWRAALAAAEPRLPFELTPAATESQLADADQLLDVSLRRSHAEWDGLEVPMPLQARAIRTFETLRALASASGDEQVATLQAELDLLSQTLPLSTTWPSTLSGRASPPHVRTNVGASWPRSRSKAHEPQRGQR